MCNHSIEDDPERRVILYILSIKYADVGMLHGFILLTDQINSFIFLNLRIVVLTCHVR